MHQDTLRKMMDVFVQYDEVVIGYFFSLIIDTACFFIIPEPLYIFIFIVALFGHFYDCLL